MTKNAVTFTGDAKDRLQSPFRGKELTSRPSIKSLILKRLTLAPLILLGVSLVVFVVIDLSPNDPARAALGVFADAESRDRFAAEHGLDDPLPLRYWRFLVDLAHLQLGESVVRPESVATLIGLTLPVTLQLVIISTLIATLSSLIFGTIAAWREGRAADRLISTAAAVLYASPSFWIGLLFIHLFAITLGIIPSGGYISFDAGLTDWFTSIIGPALVLALPFTAAMTRVTRASMADELAKDYVRTAISAGVPWPKVLIRNVLRNALIPPVTVLGLYIGALMTGAVLVETVFNLPGLGNLLITGVNQGDLGVVRGVAIVGAVTFVGVNLLVDIAYFVLSPRTSEAMTR